MEHYWDKPHAELDKILDRRQVFYSVDRDMNDCAVVGSIKMVMPADWSDGEDYESPVVENPTWLELAVFADEAIKSTQDFHHSFFEGIRPKTDETVNGVKIYQFIMGS